MRAQPTPTGQRGTNSCQGASLPREFPTVVQSPRSCRQLGGEGAEGKESTRLRSLQQRWRIRQEEGGAEPDAQMLTKITTASLLDCRKTSLPPPPSFHALSRAGFFLFIPPPTHLPSPKKARFHDGHPESAVEGRSEPTALWHRSARASPGPCRAETGRAEPGHPGPGSAAPPDTRRPPRRGKRKPLPELSLFLLPALFSVSTGDRACLP